MNQTLSDKIGVLEGRVKSGDRVLDVGCGKSLELMKWVEAQGAQYVPLDNDPDVIQLFEEAGVTCHPSTASLHGEFDVIYLSSVVHELLSLIPAFECGNIMTRLSELLTEGGCMIVRDWYSYDHSWGAKRSSLTLEGDGAEVRKWVDALQKNGVVGGLEIRGDKILGSRKDLYEIVFHSVWGLQSLNRESLETYAIPLERLTHYLHNLQLVERYDQVNSNYVIHLGKHFDKVLGILKDYPSKSITVWRKPALGEETIEIPLAVAIAAFA